MKKMFATLMLTLVLAPHALAADLQADLMAVEKNLWAAWGERRHSDSKNEHSRGTFLCFPGCA